MTTGEALKTLETVSAYTHIDTDYAYDKTDGTVKLVPGRDIADALDMGIAALRAQEEQENRELLIQEKQCNICWKWFSSSDKDGYVCPDCQRKKQERDNPKPLTLEELREIDGVVWVCYPQVTFWTLTDKMCCTRYKFSSADYGKTWLAYRNKPTEVDEDV